MQKLEDMYLKKVTGGTRQTFNENKSLISARSSDLKNVNMEPKDIVYDTNPTRERKKPIIK